MIQATVWDGKQVSQPGIIAKMPLVTYHRGDICAGPSVSSTGLRTIFNKSPAHFWVESPLNPKRIEPADKESWALGRALHLLALGEPFFAKLFVVRPDEVNGKAWQGNRTECRNWLAEQKQIGKTVLTSDHVEHIRGMAMSLGLHPLIRAGILNGQIERSIFWRDKETGIFLKSRPDSIPGDSADFADLKITRSVLYRDLQRSIEDYGYHQQGALIRTACREVLGVEMSSFTLVFVEHKPPYAVDIRTLKENDLDLGEKMNRAALLTLWRCLRDKKWPGPAGEQRDAAYIEISERARERIEDQLKYGATE